MTVRVAEYLGHNAAQPVVPYIAGQPIPNCPFSGFPCAKLDRTAPQKPVCSVWSNDDDLWIICEHRLLTTLKEVPTTQPYVANRLAEIAEVLWGPSLAPSDLAVARQHKFDGANADYVFAFNPGWRVPAAPVRFCMEIQGGGPTTNSGTLTSHVNGWEHVATGLALNDLVGVNPDIKGVWKRLLQQLFTKGLSATRVRQGIGCVVGEKLFDAIDGWVRWSELTPPEDRYIDFVVIPY